MQCDLCKTKLDDAEARFSFDCNGREKIICGVCEHKLKNVNSEDQHIKAASRNYIDYYASAIKDDDFRTLVSSYLGTTIDYSEARANEMPQFEVKQVEYQNTSSQKDSWVKFMRGITWVGIIVGSLVSIFVGLGMMTQARSNMALGFTGFLVMIGGSLASFVGAGLIMIFLNLADNIKAIKDKLYSDDKKSK